MNTDQRAEKEYPKCPACKNKFSTIALFADDGTTKKSETTVCENKDCQLKIDLKKVENWKLC